MLPAKALLRGQAELDPTVLGPALGGIIGRNWLVRPGTGSAQRIGGNAFFHQIAAHGARSCEAERHIALAIALAVGVPDQLDLRCPDLFDGSPHLVKNSATCRRQSRRTTFKFNDPVRKRLVEYVLCFSTGNRQSIIDG